MQQCWCGAGGGAGGHAPVEGGAGGGAGMETQLLLRENSGLAVLDTRESELHSTILLTSI